MKKLTKEEMDSLIEEKRLPYKVVKSVPNPYPCEASIETKKSGHIDVITYDVPNSVEGAWQFFEDVLAYPFFLIHRKHFQEQFPLLSDDIQRAKLNAIKSFISQAERLAASLNQYNYNKNNSPECIYIKLTTRWYEWPKAPLPTFDSLEAKVYAEYVLMREWLEQELISTKLNSPTNPMKGLFCYLVGNSGLMERGQNESVESFCKRVCERYELTYRDKVRQHFQAPRGNPKYMEGVTKFILPNIDISSRSIIESFIKND